MKKIHELLDIDEETLDDIKTDVVETTETESQELTVGGAMDVQESLPDAEEQVLQQDFENAMDNIRDAIDTAKDAVEKIAVIAHTSEVNKDFDTLANMLKLVISGSETTVSIYSKKLEYYERKKKTRIMSANAGLPADPNNKNSFHIEKAVFTGTLEQLIDSEKNEKKGE